MILVKMMKISHTVAKLVTQSLILLNSELCDKKKLKICHTVAKLVTLKHIHMETFYHSSIAYHYSDFGHFSTP